jgi:thiosulfate/3-mercaptopyruvate sulfurtransferase
MSRNDVLVTADWAQENLGTPGLVFVEVDEDTSAYDGGHLEGAVKLDWKKDLQDPLRRDFVDKAGFEALLSSRGISNDDTVVLYGGNNNWFAAYAYWYFKLYGHENVKLIDGGRKKWELDSRPLSKETVERPATQYKASDPDLSIRAFRDEVVASIGSKNLIDVRSPDEFSGKILAPAHLPQEMAQKGGQRGRHVQDRRAARGALRRAGVRRQQGDHRLLPHRRALEPHLVRAARAAGQARRQELRRQLGRVRLAGRRPDREVS